MKNINTQLIDPFTFEYYRVYPGGNDAVAIILSDLKSDDSTIYKLLTLFIRISIGNNEDDKLKFINLVNKIGAINVYSKLSELLLRDRKIILLMPYAYNFAKELTSSCIDIESVKLGIILLGILCCGKEEKELILDLAYDEEYTYYCIRSIIYLFNNYDNVIWNIARYTYGWGRIHCVQYLKNSTNEDIKKWLLFKGYNNNININFTLMDSILAGKLESLLLLDNISKKMFSQSTILIKLMLSNYESIDFENMNLSGLLVNYLRHYSIHNDIIDCVVLKNIYDISCNNTDAPNFYNYESVIKDINY